MMIFAGYCHCMFTKNCNPSPESIDIKLLGQWMHEHAISRVELAKALGLQVTVIHNWFARQSIPKNAQASLRHMMRDICPIELESQIAVRMKNSTLNKISKKAVGEGKSLEEWIVQAIESRLDG